MEEVEGAAEEAAALEVTAAEVTAAEVAALEVTAAEVAAAAEEEAEALVEPLLAAPINKQYEQHEQNKSLHRYFYIYKNLPPVAAWMVKKGV